MIQSDALSQRPDFIPEEYHNNENRVLLPENMFINLIDVDLQDRIANSTNYDFDVKNALEMLLEKGPNTLQNDLEDWKLEKHNSQNVMFYKGKNYIPNDLDLRWDIQENWRLIIRSKLIIGGQDLEPLSNDMYRVVGSANNSR